ncbi:MAG: hypothetical protein HKN76_02865 [Saprospiraceae bacterium]|nr:hypothetical protein [Saprospiraceae bacterium]
MLEETNGYYLLTQSSTSYGKATIDVEDLIRSMDGGVQHQTYAYFTYAVLINGALLH